MTNIQDQFNATKSGDFVLAPGEYEGPLVIDRPCVFDEQGQLCGRMLVLCCRWPQKRCR